MNVQAGGHCEAPVCAGMLRLPQLPVEEGHDLPAGAGIIGGEGGFAGAGSDACPGGP